MKTAIALALTTIVFSMTAALAGTDLARADARGDIELPAGDVTRAGPHSLPLGPLQVADVDTDGDGLVSFDELFRADAPLLLPLRGN